MKMKSVLIGCYAVLLFSAPAGAQPFLYLAAVEGPGGPVREIKVVDTVTTTVSNTVSLPYAFGFPRWVVVLPDGSRGYTAGSTSLVAIFQDAVTGSITIPGPSTSAEVSLDGSRLYVVNSGNLVTVIDTAANTVLTSLNLGAVSNPKKITIRADGLRAFIVDDTGLSVLDIDPASGTYHTVLAHIASGGVVVTAFAATPDGTKGYLAGPSTLLVDLVSYTASVLAPVRSYDVTMDPGGQQAYLLLGTTEYDVRLIQTATDEITGNIGPEFAAHILADPAGGRLWVSDLSLSCSGDLFSAKVYGVDPQTNLRTTLNLPSVGINSMYIR